MLPHQALDRTERPLGRVIGMDLDKKGDPQGYVILLEGDAAETVLGATRGLLVVPVKDAEVREAAEPVLVLKANMERLKRGWTAGAAGDDEDPSAW